MTYHDKQGNEISRARFFELFADKSYQQLKSDHLLGYHVSTVWLGSYGKDVLFETITFGPDGKEAACHRSATEAEANRWHYVMLGIIVEAAHRHGYELTVRGHKGLRLVFTPSLELI